MKKPILSILIILAVLILGIGVWWFMKQPNTNSDTNILGNSNTNTHTPDPNNPKYDLIRPENIKANDTISSPLRLSGTARGTWFFEASFPVHLLNSQGEEIATGIAQAKSDWMTKDFVPFEVVLTFETPTTGQTGTIVFQKDNPSGLPENEDFLSIPIRFAAGSTDTTLEGQVNGGCVVTGCSHQICGEEEVTTDCMYKDEYACYKTATCERQADDKCGWTATTALTECLASKSKPIQL